ncbi:MAG: hypothetical protein HGA81_04735 [Chlorobium limicola]|jgi:putative transposase|nr:hypothetical protein [Chlorobium limicola]
MTRRQRYSVCLKGYDYEQSGAYFVTICTNNRLCLFGDIEDGNIYLHGYSEVVQSVWNETPRYYAGVASDAFVIMPDHVHAIVDLS